MRFENMLARKYIHAQKRHSALTVCSIIVSVALMTMIVCCITTFQAVTRAAAFDKAPYHLLIYSVTKEEGGRISGYDHVESCTLEKNPETGGFTAKVLFKGYLGNWDEFLARFDKDNDLGLDIVVDESAFEQMSYDAVESPDYTVNYTLIMMDKIEYNGRMDTLVNMASMMIYVIFLAFLLRLIIDTAFEVSSKERERQFGVLQSVGATPKQIVRIMTHEALLLCTAGLPLGLLAGIGTAYLAFRAVLSSGVADYYFTAEKAKELVHFHVSPVMILICAAVGLVWVLLSAYGTGRRVIRKSPLEAMSARPNAVKKIKKRSLMGLLFGWEGKLAARNSRRQPKRFIITILALTLSITAFSTITSAVDTVSKFIAETFEENGMGYDLWVGAPGEDTIKENVEALKETGYFKEVECGAYVPTVWSELNRSQCDMMFYTKGEFERYFPNSPLSYDELNASGGFLMIITDPAKKDYSPEEIDVTIKRRDKITAEEAASLPEDEVQTVDSHDESSETVEPVYYKKTDLPATLKIAAIVREKPDYLMFDTEIRCYLIATADQYDLGRDLYGSSYRLTMDCVLKDHSEYEPVKHWLESNSKGFTLSFDNFSQRRSIETTITSIRIFALFFDLLIGVIALVNLVNIISTGIIDRRSELAAMECVGMTRWQLRKLVLVECLQYALISCVGSVVLSFILLRGTKLFLKSIELIEDKNDQLVAFSQTLVRILLAGAAAFIAAAAASLIPLKEMERTELVDRIRTIE
ncbi:MAG: ABC transporter permease [Ruminococcus sp.]|nr:ABC transporter permease [Ruminococcus sp.]